MLLRIHLILHPVLFLAFAVVAQPESATREAAKAAHNTFDTKHLPGVAVAVAKGHDWIWTDSYGYANVHDSVAIDPQTSLFRIGSVSKTLTALGLLELYQTGKIDLDVDIHDYVVEFPERDMSPTVRQVAMHVGGIRHYNDGEFLNSAHYNTVGDGLGIFVNDDLKFNPGTKFSYSSYGWNLISAAMETTSGEEFLSFMHKSVFKPAEMNSTYADDATKNIGNRVSFYENNSMLSPQVDNSYKWASGGFLSTATDLIKFGQAILYNVLISEKTLEEATLTYTLEDGIQTRYGIGFEVGVDKKGRHWIGHGGGSVGGTTMFMIYPEEELIIVVLANQSNAKIRKLAFGLADTFLKQ